MTPASSLRPAKSDDQSYDSSDSLAQFAELLTELLIRYLILDASLELLNVTHVVDVYFLLLVVCVQVSELV